MNDLFSQLFEQVVFGGRGEEYIQQGPPERVEIIEDLSEVVEKEEVIEDWTEGNPNKIVCDDYSYLFTGLKI